MFSGGVSGPLGDSSYVKKHHKGVLQMFFYTRNRHTVEYGTPDCTIFTHMIQIYP